MIILLILVIQNHKSKAHCMKNTIFTTAIIAAALGFSQAANAQSAEDTKNAEILKIGVGGTFGKPKIIRSLDNLAIAQITVNYKLSTTEKTVVKDKSSGQIAGAKVSAFLETSDGELATADFQEVSDYFYSYFQKKLKQNGIDTVAWSTIAAADFYKEADEKKADEDQEKKSGQVWVTNNANKGNTIYGGKIGFAFGKGMRAVKFAKAMGAPIGYFYVTIDFADVVMNMDLKVSKEERWLDIKTTTTKKYDAHVRANMKVTTSEMGLSMLENEKGVVETISLTEELESNAPYNATAYQDPSRLKNNLFRFAKEMNPVIVETTKAEYKAAAKKACEKYADAFVAKAVIMKKD